jgi:DNA-binding HxlR family transcriptional regulator
MKNKNNQHQQDFVYQGKSYPCCTSLTMGLIGGKWKTVILYHLLQGPLRYSELRQQMPQVTERTLSLQLKALEKDQLIKRKVYHQKPPLKVSYSLTDLGKTLEPLILQLAQWGELVMQNQASKTQAQTEK